MEASSTGRDLERSPASARETALDETLIDYLLALTPEERLRLNDRQAELAERLRGALGGDACPR